MTLEPFLYEAAARTLFAPFGGLPRIRARAIEACAPRPGTTVLEMGCGPGVLTAALVARGARVVAVDASPSMLRVAARRVPRASLVQADVRTYTPDARFDAILLSFVMHELPVSDWPSCRRRPLVVCGAECFTESRLVRSTSGSMPTFLPCSTGRDWSPARTFGSPADVFG